MSEAKVLISGPIVGNAKEAGDTYPYTMLEDVIMQLEWQKPFDSVRVTINSEGGRVDKGLGIYDHLRSLGSDITITTEAIGQCSSIATIVLLAGSRRLIHEHTECLIHLPRGGCDGATAAEAQQWADDMAACQQKLIDVSAERTGQPADVIAARMAEEKLVTPDDMVALGFATMVLKPVTALATLPITASSASSPSSHDDTPTWAQNLMSKFHAALALMTAAVSGAANPITAQAATAADTTDAPVSLDVTTADGATLTIDTGDRTTYEVGDSVLDADGAAAADGDYVLSDGNTIAVAGGAISAITEPAAADAATASAEGDDTMTQVLSAITSLAKEVQTIKQAQAQTGATVNRVAAATGSTARPARAAAPAAGATAADEDPVKAAADRRAARRAGRFGTSN